MFKHYFEAIADKISIYPLFSLVVFFAFFIGLFIWVIRANPEYISEMSDKPMHD
jgi:hypothetical protein